MHSAFYIVNEGRADGAAPFRPLRAGARRSVHKVGQWVAMRQRMGRGRCLTSDLNLRFGADDQPRRTLTSP